MKQRALLPEWLISMNQKVNSSPQFIDLVLVELGFLLIFLSTDAFIDIIVTLCETSFELQFWHENFFFMVMFALCITTLGLIPVCFYLHRSQRIGSFLKLSLCVQVCFNFIICLQCLGYNLTILPKYWQMNWINTYNLMIGQAIPCFIIFLIFYHYYLNKRD